MTPTVVSTFTRDGQTGVSFVVPVHNGAALIRETLASILAQADGRPMEIIVVDDHSHDDSSAVLRRLAAKWPLRLVAGEGCGAAAAINTGVRAARYPIICQVDQDVVLGPHWMPLLAAELDDPSVAAAQGYYTSRPEATLCARAMGLDLEQRYAGVDRYTEHVCTGNSAYRADALRRVGLFDETFGYGYDNDMSYRLRDAGYRLTFCRAAQGIHRWREGFTGYLVQQYGFGYGRMDLVAKHPRRLAGDSVSPAGMMSHPLVMSIAVAGMVAVLVMAVTAGPWRTVAFGVVAVLGALALERLAAGLTAAWRFRDTTPLVFPLLHLARDAAWVAAIVMWSLRRLSRRPPKPSHSMRGRTFLVGGARQVDLPHDISTRPSAPKRILGLIPAYNEVRNLPGVIDEVRACRPDLDILVIDDGSTDATRALLERVDVRWLRFPERMGVGGAMRAGLRYAVRLGYDAAVRIDGDGQHRADDIDLLLGPIHRDRVDVVLGSRYARPIAGHPSGARPLQRLLAACLSALTGMRVTDPTSGFCALGARAIGVLAEHHPTGYPEPELRLFLSRNALRVVEVPVRARSRQSGKTSLTPGRVTAAGARVLLAMIIVPLRCAVGGLARD